MRFLARFSWLGGGENGRRDLMWCQHPGFRKLVLQQAACRVRASPGCIPGCPSPVASGVFVLFALSIDVASVGTGGLLGQISVVTRIEHVCPVFANPQPFSRFAFAHSALMQP